MRAFLILGFMLMLTLIAFGCTGGQTSSEKKEAGDIGSLPDIRTGDTKTEEAIDATGPSQPPDLAAAGIPIPIDLGGGLEPDEWTYLNECILCHYVSTGNFPANDYATVDLAGVGNKYDSAGFLEHLSDHPPGTDVSFADRFTEVQMDKLIEWLLTLTDEPVEKPSEEGKTE